MNPIENMDIPSAINKSEGSKLIICNSRKTSKIKTHKIFVKNFRFHAIFDQKFSAQQCRQLIEGRNGMHK